MTIEDIQHFLSEAKSLIRIGKWEFVRRKKNLDSLTSLNITVPQAKAALLTLTYREYDRGPSPDNDRSGEVWEFITQLDSAEIYIKLKIDCRGCVCLSFHESAGPKTLPYKNM